MKRKKLKRKGLQKPLNTKEAAARLQRAKGHVREALKLPAVKRF